MNSLKQLALFLCYSVFSLLLSSCGFHLQGTIDLPPQLHTFYVESSAPYSPLMRTLRSTLRYSNITIVDSPNQAPLILNVSDENISTADTSVANLTQMRTCNVTMTVTFSLRDKKGNIIIPASSVSATQTITLMEDELLNNSTKLADAKTTLRQLVINQMMFHFSARNTTKALEKYFPNDFETQHVKNVR